MKRLFLFIIVFILCCGSVSATAGTGTLTVMTDKEGITLGICKIAYVGENLNYILTDAFAGSGIDPTAEINAERNPNLYATLEKYADENRITRTYKSTGKDGVLVFTDLDAGLYLITQKLDGGADYMVAAFLVPMPYSNGFHITAQPKIKQIPSTPSVEPSKTPTVTPGKPPNATPTPSEPPSELPSETPSRPPTIPSIVIPNTPDEEHPYAPAPETGGNSCSIIIIAVGLFLLWLFIILFLLWRKRKKEKEK